MVADVPLDAAGRRVRTLTATLTRLGIALARADRDGDLQALVDEVEAVTACITEAAASDLDEVRAKLTVLRHRLEDHLSPATSGEALTLALAASVVRDLDRLAA